jgi:hypothetical protein
MEKGIAIVRRLAGGGVRLPRARRDVEGDGPGGEGLIRRAAE